VDQLAYAVITPYTIMKSRTGAVLARLLGQASSELIAAQMFAPTCEFAEQVAEGIRPGSSAEDEKLREIIRRYIRDNLSPDHTGRPRRVLMLAFRGPDAVAEISRIVGHLRISDSSGETIRDAYGDLLWNPDGTVRYFEPAVLIADSAEGALRDLAMWVRFARTQPALLEGVCVYEHPDKVQQTLVLIKPDSWQQKSARPGAIMDMFSRTGLRIIGCKLCRMSVRQALEFYGPVRSALHKKLAPRIARTAREILEREFGIPLGEEVEKALARDVGAPYAEDQFQRIIEFMSGRRPDQPPEDEWDQPGEARCLALVYEGEDAVAKIRNVLGPTDPSKAPEGTVRREFGHDVMVNTAHASDSPENAQREMRILGMREGNFAEIVENALKEIGYAE